VFSKQLVVAALAFLYPLVAPQSIPEVGSTASLRVADNDTDQEADPAVEDSNDSDDTVQTEVTVVPEAGKKILDLHTAQGIALEGNPNLQASAERVQQAKLRVRQAQALWYPFLDVSGSASKTYIPERDYKAAKQGASAPFVGSFVGSTQARWTGGIRSYVGWVNSLLGGGPISVLPVPIGSGLLGLSQDAIQNGLQAANARRGVDDSFESYRVSVVASWIVFNGFERKFSVAETKLGSMESQAAYRESQRLLLSAVAQSFYAAQLGRENIAIAEADEAFNMRQLVEAKARRKKGTGSKSDVLNFEVRVNGARASLIRSHNDFHTALIALSELLAFEGSEFPEGYVLADLAHESLEDLEPPAGRALVGIAEINRPDLEQSQFQVDRTRATIGRRRAPFYPSVSTFASKDASRSDNARFREDDFGTSLGLDIRYTLFAGGGNHARLKEAKSQNREAERILFSTELAVASEVLQSAEDLTASQQSLVLQRANAVFVSENRDLVEKEYDAGVASLVRLNEAQRDLIAAQGDLALARVALQLAWHNLRTATAETLGEHSLIDEGA